MSPHLFVIHFPVTLILVAALLDLLGIGLGERVLRDWSWRFLLAGALAVFLSFVTGEGAKLAAASAAIDFQRLSTHENWGSAGTWGMVIAALVRSLWRRRLSGVYGWLNLAIVLAASGLVVAITLSGSQVRHG